MRVKAPLLFVLAAAAVGLFLLAQYQSGRKDPDLGSGPRQEQPVREADSSESELQPAVAFTPSAATPTDAGVAAAATKPSAQPTIETESESLPSAQADPLGMSPAADAVSGDVLRGRVVDGETTLGIPRATIVARDREMVPLGTSTSDDHGCFEFPPTGSRARTLEIAAPGYAFHWWRMTQSGALPQGNDCGQRYELRPGSTLHGRVVDERGEPVREGVVVAYDEVARAYIGELSSKSDRWNLQRYDGGGEPLLDVAARTEVRADGTFELAGMPIGEKYHPIFFHEEFLRVFQDPVVLESAEPEPVVLGVTRAATVTGRAILPELAPGARAGVWFCHHRHTRMFGAGPEVWAPLENDGSFRSGPLYGSEELWVRFSIGTLVDGRQQRVYKDLRFPLALGETRELEVDLTTGMRSVH